MKMTFKKEVKHSVVYETANEDAPCRSVYVMKEWLDAQGCMVPPNAIELEVKVVDK